MEKITGNEPANPCDTLIDGNVGSVTGLTIRQEFAGRIMGHLMSKGDIAAWFARDNRTSTEKFYAQKAVAAADELIKALNK